MSNDNRNDHIGENISEEALSEVSGGEIRKGVSKLAILTRWGGEPGRATAGRTRKQRRLMKCLSRELPNRELPW